MEEQGGKISQAIFNLPYQTSTLTILGQFSIGKGIDKQTSRRE